MRWEVMFTGADNEIDIFIKTLFDVSKKDNINLTYTRKNNVITVQFDLETELMKQIKLPEGVVMACLTPKDENKNIQFNNTFEVKPTISGKELYRAIAKRITQDFYRKY